MFEIERRLAFNHPRRELAVVGWCAADGGTPIDELWVVCAGLRTPCLISGFRPEVGRQLSAPGLRPVGFSTRFAFGGVDMATLFARGESGEYRLGDFAIGWSEARKPESEAGQYAAWLRRHEPSLRGQVPEHEALIKSFARTPLFSVILPTYNTELYHLHRCIESISAQHYPHWQLCITDDGSSNRRVIEYLEQAASADSRIRLTFARDRRGISAASNRSIAAADGEFILLLDHDDEFHPTALLEVARCLDAHPATDLVYSDEDKIDQLGVRSHPTFKPGYDVDLLAGFDYLGHLVAIRSALVRELGGFRSEADGAQDWDLLLRTVEAIDRQRIRHIQKPLYHWRMHSQSTAYSLDVKPYAVRAWDGVLARHAATQQNCGAQEGLFRGSMRIRREVPEGTRVAVVFRERDGQHQRAFLGRSRVARGTSFFSLAGGGMTSADDPGGPSSVGLPASDVTIVVRGPIDTVNHHFLEELAAQAVRPDCGIVGATVLGPDRTILTAGLACSSDGTWVNLYEGMAHDRLGYMGLAKVVRAVASIGPQAFAFRTSRLEELGPGLLREDALGDLCAALVKSAHDRGLAVLHTPYAIVTLQADAGISFPDRDALPPPDRMVNRNLEAFPSLAAVMRSGIS